MNESASSENYLSHKKRSKFRKDVTNTTPEDSGKESDNFEEDLIILKNLNTNTQYKFIKQKLRETIKDRIIALEKHKFSKFSEAFPFFFICPDLVCICIFLF